MVCNNSHRSVCSFGSDSHQSHSSLCWHPARKGISQIFMVHWEENKQKSSISYLCPKYSKGTKMKRSRYGTDDIDSRFPSEDYSRGFAGGAMLQ